MQALQAPGGLLQMLPADVEGHVGRRLQGLQQGAHLAGTSRPELHDHAGAEGGGDRLRLCRQHANLPPGEFVFRLVADLIEQPRSFGVIEKPGR